MTKAERERAVGSERDRAIAEAVREACREVADEARDTIDGVDLDAIIAAVDAQHPPPALPRDVAMRVAREAADEATAQDNVVPESTLAAIVDRHVPTDEEREAMDAVVEAALIVCDAPTDSDPDGPVQAACDDFRDKCDRLLAIRAKRGAQ